MWKPTQLFFKPPNTESEVSSQNKVSEAKGKCSIINCVTMFVRAMSTSWLLYSLICFFLLIFYYF